MINQTGIAIIIKAFLPTGKNIDQQFEALTIVKKAHETGDYSALLAAATIGEVKTEQKTRRMEPLSPVMQDIVDSLRDEPAAPIKGAGNVAEFAAATEAKPEPAEPEAAAEEWAMNKQPAVEPTPRTSRRR